MPAILRSLSQWIVDSDARRQFEQFRIEQRDLQHDYLRARADDYYVGLVDQLFDFLRDTELVPSSEWARLGNALNQFSAPGHETELQRFGIDPQEARLFSATAFYFGSYPASAYLVLRQMEPPPGSGPPRAIFDFLARPPELGSALARQLLGQLARGSETNIARLCNLAEQDERAAFAAGPNEWIAAKLWLRLTKRFQQSNLRAVLPDGFSAFWSPLVDSMISRRPAVYEFFPSQIAAIRAGLLSSDASFSLQMPTGAGKTALCETLLFSQSRRFPEGVSILLVPFRSLAAELRRSIVPRLRGMGVTAACAYGGTVPSQQEIQSLDRAQVLVATPETLSGILTADQGFLGRVTLAICDEGHLLEASGRGIGLEFLLARFKAQPLGPPRFVFISAIVPNIEEINAWLGGTAETVVRSDYRPAYAEYALLQTSGRAANAPVELVMHAEQPATVRYTIPAFLSREDFQYFNPRTGRRNTYTFSSYKCRAVAAARKALPMGGVVIFAANKRGDQGAIGVGLELLNQLAVDTRLPIPADFGSSERRAKVQGYLTAEFGAHWIGTRLVSAGAVLHHGDLPQETREVLESLLREEHVRLAICTSTLAEGVNLPIRTLVLYSVQRSGRNGRPVPLKARDIKNLVGRAGRAGATTRGLVICANENQWNLVEPVALDQPGENVRGSLYLFLTRLASFIAQRPNYHPTNEIMETDPGYFDVVDGLDSVLIDLLAEELGEAQLLQTVQQVVNATFAATAIDGRRRELLDTIVRARAARIGELRTQQRLDWIKGSGARFRTLRQVENGLLPMLTTWDNIASVTDQRLITAMFDWAWPQREVQAAATEAYRIAATELPGVRDQVLQVLRAWQQGFTYQEIAQVTGLDIDELLGVLGRVVGSILVTQIEQGVSLLKKLVEEQGRALSPAVEQFADSLRFGLSSPKAVALASAGVRHRRAAHALGLCARLQATQENNPQALLGLARTELQSDPRRWTETLGELVFNHTRADVDA